MSLSNGELSAADVAAVMGNNNGDGMWGNGNGTFWIFILFLFAIMSGNWGNNGGNDAAMPVYPAIQQGFDQAAITGQLAGINAAVSNGFANAEVARCNSQANLTNQLNTIAMNQQNCCCENRAAVADLKYTISTEEATTRAANAAGTQSILDKLCQLEMDNLKSQLDAKNDIIAQLRQQADLASLRESQNAQTAQILANNQAQTAALEQYLNPAPVPAYVVANPNGCSCNQSTCGCGAF